MDGGGAFIARPPAALAPSWLAVKISLVKYVILVVAIFCTLVSEANAKPRDAKKGETQYLENADRIILEDSMAAKSVASAAPIEKPTPLPTLLSPAPDEDEEESGEKTILGHSKKVRASPPAVIRNSYFFVGQEVPYPKAYSAPSVRTDANGAAFFTPAQPRSFESRQVGVSIQNNESGQSLRVTELEGFVNYGSPMQTVVPVYNAKGEVTGTRVIALPNNILQPVFKTYRQER